MNKIVKIALGVVLILGISSTTASADISKGQKLYLKKLKNTCGMNGGTMASRHTQAEWEKIHKEGKLVHEIKTICPKAKDKALEDRFLQHYYDFFHNYGSDSGNIPSC